jgi:hypothetical protein
MLSRLGQVESWRNGDEAGMFPEVPADSVPRLALSISTELVLAIAVSLLALARAETELPIEDLSPSMTRHPVPKSKSRPIYYRISFQLLVIEVLL